MNLLATSELCAVNLPGGQKYAYTLNRYLSGLDWRWSGVDISYIQWDILALIDVLTFNVNIRRHCAFVRGGQRVQLLSTQSILLIDTNLYVLYSPFLGEVF